MDIQIASGNNMICVTISGSCAVFEAAELESLIAAAAGPHRLARAG